jgi:putative nucleotidyltransferase with HDIG domain
MVVQKNKVNELFRKSYYAIFFVLTLLFIYLLFPKQGTFKYEFQKGNPWRHKNLIAPFDFPVLKPNEVLDAEKDSIVKAFIPYFIIDNSIGAKQITLLEKDLQNSLNSKLIKGNITEIKQLKTNWGQILLQLYEKGILENPTDLNGPLSGKTKMYIINDKMATVKNVSEVMSLKSAYLKMNELINESIIKNPAFLKYQQVINFEKYLEPNLKFDQTTNETSLNESVESISTTRGVIQSGVRIISEGDIINNENFILLESLKKAYANNSIYGGWISTIIFGQMLLVTVLLLVLFFYLQVFNRELAWKKRNFSLIFTNILMTFLLARLVYENNSLNFYILPVCILPIIIRTFIGVRMSIFIHLITMLMIGFLAPNSFEFVFIQMIAGTMAVVSLNKLHRRGHLVLTAILVTLTYCIIFVGFGLIKEGNFRSIEWSGLKWFGLNGLLLLSAYPLIFIYEKIFGFISDVTLLELSDTNHPLLRRMAEEAPGSFQHSLQVANLAQEVIVRTGGNPLLVRTGSLYHDVGKIINSQFYIENQIAGQNPHEKLSFSKSAEMIINHVGEGVTLAKKYKIPDPIIDFIRMHHGKSVARYFYLKFKEKNPGKEIEIKKFMYPGPSPVTRETAVVMLADGVEAATRSLPEKNEDSLRMVIGQIIDEKVRNHELDDAPITFKDIKDIKEIFLRKLINIYHIRIQYPNLE